MLGIVCKIIIYRRGRFIKTGSESYLVHTHYSVLRKNTNRRKAGQAYKNGKRARQQQLAKGGQAKKKRE